MADRPRLLIVDDELYNRDLLVRTFARVCDVMATGSASDALSLLDRWPADLVLTDQSLVGTTGSELAREVRARWPHIRVVAVTGYDADPSVREARAEGIFDDVVTKPWQPTALRARILGLLGA